MPTQLPRVTFARDESDAEWIKRILAKLKEFGIETPNTCDAIRYGLRIAGGATQKNALAEVISIRKRYLNGQKPRDDIGQYKSRRAKGRARS